MEDELSWHSREYLAILLHYYNRNGDGEWSDVAQNQRMRRRHKADETHKLAVEYMKKNIPISSRGKYRL